MKNKNILYNLLNLILIIFALSFIIPMFQDITLLEDGFFGIYGGLSVLMTIITFILLFIINIVMGVLNIRVKNILIGVLNIVFGCISGISLFFIIAYVDSYEDIYGYILFFFILSQIIITIVNLLLNKKTELGKLKMHSIIIFCIIILVCLFFSIFPRVELKKNQDKLVEAYNVLIKQGSPQILIDKSSNFYDIEGNLISNNNYIIVDVEKVDDIGTYIIVVEDENEELWIVDYKGEKIVRLNNTFTDSNLLNSLLDMSEVYTKTNCDMPIMGINYLNLEIMEDNYLKFADEDNEIIIEVEIDKTKEETDTAFIDVLDDYYMEYFECSTDEISGLEGIDLRTIYKYEKKYFLTYKNNKRVELDCNNLLIDFDDEVNNYVLYLYNNYNIPFFDEDGSGFYNLNGQKFAVNRSYLVYNTFDNYVVIYNLLNNSYYLTNYDFDISLKLEFMNYCTEEYVYADKNLYLVNNGEFEENVEKVLYTINIGEDKRYSTNFMSVYDYYMEID